ncbi:MAG: PfkB family carbohydrate kinase, partial [Acidobacteriota bacterium]|nr:PfkB family carbohydrate kinase [Acidobacteriota bacterium]
AGTHFALSSSFFTDVRVIGVVGNDFTDEEWAVFKRHNINTDDIEVVADGKTFFWRGHYEYDLNTAHTLETQLNVFETFQPKPSEESKNSKLLFLANILPMLQKEVRMSSNAEFVAMDTMNFWIDSMKDAVIETMKVVDCVIINDAEARQLADEPNIHKAAKKLMEIGDLRALVIKRGEYGAALFTKENYFAIPAYPLESVFDPTGAGDTFAGGFMGYLASQKEIDEAAMRRAMIYGSVMASFNVEEFGTKRVDRLTHDEINARFRHFKQITHFEEIPFERVTSA